MKVIADLHMHTRFSADGQDEMEEMCKSAIDKGLSYICFTDHLDSNPNDDGFNLFNYEKYSAEIDRIKEKFGDRIDILKGIEFSEPHIYQKEFEAILKKDFDLIMVAMHYLKDTYVGDLAMAHNFSKEKLFHRYYTELMKAVQTGGFDVLAHFDLPKRYLKDTYEEAELIDEILREVVNQNIALEVNTSSLRRGYTESLPDCSILKRYTRAGGKNITMGSDAHCCNDIAADFEHTFKLVKDCNLQIGVFKERKFICI